MSDVTSAPSDGLINTLVLALAQCDQQNRRLAEQTELIERLREENTQLKKGLEQKCKDVESDIQAQYRAQFQRAFEQVAEKQAEIDHLKAKLHATKVKARGRGVTDLLSSSPVLPTGLQHSSTTRTLPSPVLSGQAEPPIEEMRTQAKTSEPRTATEQSSSRKGLRSRSHPRPSLRELDLNVVAGGGRFIPGEHAKRRKRLMQDDEVAISEIAEDGGIRLHKKQKGASDAAAKPSSESAYNRLGNLLDAKAPVSPRLLGEQNNSALIGSDFLLDSTPSKSASTSLGLPTPDTDNRFKRPRPLSNTTTRGEGPTGQTPLRSTPTDQLQLKDFKLNPAVNAGLEHAYSETIRGEERKCLPGCTRECCINTFRALAATLPDFSGRDGQHFSEYELLLNFLGPGSEAKIRSLTPKARENLVHEARTKLIADTYGKMHRNVHERGRSPPGFWRTDMPGSQEAQNDRVLARAVERDEIERRHRDAMRTDGRWMFADE